VRRLGRADDILEQHLAGQAVADVLVADEAGGVDRDQRDGDFFLGRSADRLDIITSHGGYTGGIDKNGLRFGISTDDFQYGLVQLLLPSENHVIFQHFGGKAAPVELRTAGTGAPVVPRVARAGYGAVDKMDYIGDRH
jgi:hypothetical protein